MSNEIICKTCGLENPHSSKFCNNCGAKLPLSTHIICPNCQTPNTQDRIFCDTCGTRLVRETSQIKLEEPEDDSPTTNEPFSLPVRRPGETGELNPNVVPDWLRTGDIASAKDAADSALEKPEKKGTSDLPDWLVHESDPDPIINAPTTISTEFYRDLLNKAEDLPQPDDLFPDEDDANLPDWLSDANDMMVTPSADDQANTGLTGWLSDLDENDLTEETTSSPPQSEEDVSSGLTDWLHELDDLNNPAEAQAAENAAALEDLLSGLPNEEADSSDWLQELGPAQTDVLPGQLDSSDEETADDLPGWMDELGPLQTNLLDPSQIAELTGPLASNFDDADMVDDEEAGADVSFTDLFETASDEMETLPDWLDTAVEAADSFLKDVPDEFEEAIGSDALVEMGSDWFAAEEASDEESLDWLSDTGDLEIAADDDFGQEEIDFDTAVAEEAPQTDLTVEDDWGFADELPGRATSAEGNDLDWLSDMEAIETGALAIAPEPEETAVTSEHLLEPETESPDEAEAVYDEADDDSWTSDTFFAETAVGEDLPDWLSQLGKSDKPADKSEMDSSREELPEWIASMRPSEGIIGSELPGVFSEMDLRDTLEGIPEELAGAELPEWLQNTPLDSVSPPPLLEQDNEGSLEIPDWLQPGLAEAESTVPTPTAPSDQVETGSSRDEWRSLLEELPPLTPLAESLPKADIPEWVQQLKPPELMGEAPREPEGPEEISGPLKGMHGIVSIEPVIARPRSAALPTPNITTPEQQQQVALLRQLTQEMPDTAVTLSTKPAYGTAVWLRLSLAILLVVALMVGLRGPSLVDTTGAIPANVQDVATAVSAAAGQPVLVAFEYTPAMAGELSPQAELLLAQLAANGSPILLTSQYAAGTAVASDLVADIDAQMIGYLPGEGIGLRQLGDCLAQRNECEQLNGRMLDDEIITNLRKTSLIIVLTADRDNLVNWVEQVGSVATDVPLVAGVTQALTPLANSYATTKQLSGLLGGMPGAAKYAQLTSLPENNIQAQLNAQIVGQLLAGALLLIGLLAYGITDYMNSRRG